MTQFLQKLPQTTKENEDILPILFSMLNFPDDDIKSIVAARDALNKSIQQQAVAGKTKSGIAGFFKQGKKWFWNYYK